MTTFNIGSQNAGSIENVGGDMVVHGGIHGTANVHILELRDRLAELKAEVDRLALPAATRAAASEALADAEAEAAAPDPRPNRIRDSLRRVTGALEDGGALATAGVGLVRALGSAVSLVALLA
jgi:hypothetical protein